MRDQQGCSLRGGGTELSFVLCVAVMRGAPPLPPVGRWTMMTTSHMHTLTHTHPASLPHPLWHHPCWLAADWPEGRCVRGILQSVAAVRHCWSFFFFALALFSFWNRTAATVRMCARVAAVLVHPSLSLPPERKSPETHSRFLLLNIFTLFSSWILNTSDFGINLHLSRSDCVDAKLG